MTRQNYLAIDVGGTQIKYALISQEGNMLTNDKLDSPDNLEDFLKVIDHLVAPLVSDIQGIAFSVPGKVDSDNGVIYLGGSLTYLDGLNIREHIQQHFDLPVAVQNDGKAAVLAEQWRGSLQDVKNGAAIVLGTGVGGGLILDGKLRLGSHFQAGELSYVMLNPAGQGFSKMTGQLGSAVGMIERINFALGNSDSKNGRLVFEALQAGNPRAKALFEEYCRYIAYLALNLQATLDLDRIVIGGGISAQPLLVEEINRQYDLYLASDFITDMTLTRPQIVAASSGNGANLYGALYQLLKEQDVL